MTNLSLNALWRYVIGGELDDEPREFTGLAFGSDLTPVVFNNPVAYGQAQAAPFTDILGREEGIEDTLDMFG
jgi:hypothetical protein